ncbi:ribbon-helix-helix domain-containing protein [Staphylococcus pseudintermedius]|uniref:ribbon-helix-helix domain-containing protein n=1 Tax=Staphylococcus pseudintermedius TaxID=283734 RepID=UPI003D7EC388
MSALCYIICEVIKLIKDTNTRISVTVSKDNRDKLKELAKKENRSMSNMVEHLITSYIERSSKK